MRVLNLRPVVYASLIFFCIEMSKPILSALFKIYNCQSLFNRLYLLKLFWGCFSRISHHVMTANAWRVSLCSRYSNWLGDGLKHQSEIILQSELVRHRSPSGCQQIDNLCFASKFNIDFDQVLIIQCFYQCVTLEIQIYWIIFSYSFTIAFTICSTIAQWIANKYWKCSNRVRCHFGITGKLEWKSADIDSHSA